MARPEFADDTVEVVAQMGVERLLPAYIGECPAGEEVQLKPIEPRFVARRRHGRVESGLPSPYVPFYGTADRVGGMAHPVLDLVSPRHFHPARGREPAKPSHGVGRRVPA